MDHNLLLLEVHLSGYHQYLYLWFLIKNFLDQFGNYPSKISIKAYDLIKDLLQRFIYYRNYSGFDIDYETNLLNNKYNYKETEEQGLRNQSFYIVKHKELEVIDLTNK